MSQAVSKRTIPVVDIFAGPGGLSEGFHALNKKPGKHSFEICLSVEKNNNAYNTLKLRYFFRKFPKNTVPDAYYKLEYRKAENDFNYDELYKKYPKIIEDIERKVKLCELGIDSVSTEKIDALIRESLNRSKHDHWVLIGGPPCQAYSTVGRSRNRGNRKYVAELDERHFLYKEYLRIITQHWPSVFVMENVKGILTAKVNNKPIFEQILTDLRNPAGAIQKHQLGSVCYKYRIFSFVKHPDSFSPDGFPAFKRPHDFVIECEKYGIPQARHRVILLGIREDIRTDSRKILKRCDRTVPVLDVITGLPTLRSGLSGEEDTFDLWVNKIKGVANQSWFSEAAKLPKYDGVFDMIRKILSDFGEGMSGCGNSSEVIKYRASANYLPEWYLDPKMTKVFNTSTRKHRVEDLHRYLFAACFSTVHRYSPVLMDFPEGLLPDHRNTVKAVRSRSGHFADRFRVQLMNKPATTVMSHISKDGHYYIHPDPSQCRSLTVREVARLQTFPDNYIFTGSRTQQYVQVGNAVPPLLARQLAEIVLEILEGNKKMDTLSKEKRSWNMSRIKGKNTEPERKVRSFLHRRGYRFRLHRKDIPGNPDIVLPKYRTVIFIHGCYWHRHPGCRYAYNPKSSVDFWNKKFQKNVERDRRNTEKLKKAGWDVRIVWECETGNDEAVENALGDFLSRFE